MRDPKIGDRVTFRPAAFMDAQRNKDSNIWPSTVTGTIDYVNRAHRFYRVAFEVHGQIMKESIKY